MSPFCVFGRGQPAPVIFTAQKLPEHVGGPFKELAPPPGLFRLPAVAAGPIPGQWKRDEAKRSAGCLGPQQTQHRPDAEGNGKGADGIVHEVLAKLSRARDEQFPAGGGPIGIDGAPLILQEGTGHAQGIIGPIERFHLFIRPLVIGFRDGCECVEKAGIGKAAAGLLDSSQHGPFPILG